MRHDRDEYINVRYDKIDPAFFPQFEKISKLESTTYNVSTLNSINNLPIYI